jgi:hypothetical protein
MVEHYTHLQIYLQIQTHLQSNASFDFVLFKL